MAVKTSARKLIASKMQAGQGGRVQVIDDGRDCAECKAKQGQYKNIGSQSPPFHPNCRCTLSS